MKSKLEKFFKPYFKEDLFYIMVALYGSTIIFNEFSKYLLWFFGIVFLTFYSKIYIYRSKVIWGFFIPIALHVLFFWNNESYLLVIKQLEKLTVFLVFALIFIFQRNSINLKKILTYHSSIFSIIGSPRINSKDSLIGTNPKQPIDEVMNREVRMSVNTLFVTFIEQCESIHMLETNV